MSPEEKREELKAKIEAAEQRNQSRSIEAYARDAADSATQFVKDHPLVAIAGVAVIGLAIGAMTRPGRNAGVAAGRRASAFATHAVELGLAYATGLFDAASEAASQGKDRLEDLGDTLSDNAQAAKRRAVFTSGNAAAVARTVVRNAGKKAGRSSRDLRTRLTR